MHVAKVRVCYIISIVIKRKKMFCYWSLCCYHSEYYGSMYLKSSKSFSLANGILQYIVWKRIYSVKILILIINAKIYNLLHASVGCKLNCLKNSVFSCNHAILGINSSQKIFHLLWRFYCEMCKKTTSQRWNYHSNEVK